MRGARARLVCALTGHADAATPSHLGLPHRAVQPGPDGLRHLDGGLPPSRRLSRTSSGRQAASCDLNKSSRPAHQDRTRTGFSGFAVRLKCAELLKKEIFPKCPKSILD